jgi:predicted DNA-binding transcriptional regulator YafY
VSFAKKTRKKRSTKKQMVVSSLDQRLESALDKGSASCRNGQVIRIYRVLTLLENSRFGLSAKEITEIISSRGTPVHERTIYRDLDVLRSSGFPLEEKKIDKKSSSKWRIIKNSQKNAVQLSLKEIFSLYLAQNYLKPLEQTPFYDPIRSVFDKLTQNISSEAVQALASIGDELNFESGSLHALGIDEQSFQTARLAIGERQIIAFDYISSNGTKTKRKCGPQFLYFAKGGLYLIAKDMKDKVFKTFALPRIKNAEMLDVSYPEPTVDPKSYFQYCFGVYKASEPEKIVLKFSPQIAGFVKERRWHESQINRTLNSGELEVELFVGVTPELTQWVLGFGSHVYVSQPLSLRKLMAQEISRMQKIY